MPQMSTNDKKNRRNKTTVQRARKMLGWDKIIHDARRRIQNLEYSIAVCERKKAAGEPWPGLQGSTKQQHAR
jgi:hypothetical protein